MQRIVFCVGSLLRKAGPVILARSVSSERWLRHVRMMLLQIIEWRSADDTFSGVVFCQCSSHESSI